MQKMSVFFLFLLIFGQLGTTYVIKEGNVEVGRYEEADGKNEIQEISESGSKPVERKQAAELGVSEAAGEPAAGAQGTWTVQGRVLDMLSAKPLTQGTLRFLSPGEPNVDIKISWNGMFAGKLPKLKNKKSYQLTLQPPDEYKNQFLIFHSGQLAKIAPAQRLDTMKKMGVQPLISIKDHYVDLEIAVVPVMAKRNS